MPQHSDTSDRRHFLGSAVIGGISLARSCSTWAANVPERKLDNSYDGINWSSVKEVGSGTHIHCRSQRVLEILYRRSLHHLAISNYYPSAPCSAQKYAGQYAVQQEFATVKGKGYTKGTWSSPLVHFTTIPKSLSAITLMD